MENNIHTKEELKSFRDRAEQVSELEYLEKRFRTGKLCTIISDESERLAIELNKYSGFVGLTVLVKKWSEKEFSKGIIKEVSHFACSSIIFKVEYTGGSKGFDNYLMHELSIVVDKQSA